MVSLFAGGSVWISEVKISDMMVDDTTNPGLYQGIISSIIFKL